VTPSLPLLGFCSFFARCRALGFTFSSVCSFLDMKVINSLSEPFSSRTLLREDTIRQESEAQSR
jgi:hypothetical protein